MRMFLKTPITQWNIAIGIWPGNLIIMIEGMGPNTLKFESLFVEFFIVSIDYLQHDCFPSEQGQADEEIGGNII